MKTETFCVLTRAGGIVTLDRIGLSAVVAELPDAVAVWRADMDGWREWAESYSWGRFW